MPAPHRPALPGSAGAAPPAPEATGPERRTAPGRGRAGTALARLLGFWPGLVLATMVAIAASFLSEHYGGPVMLFALLLGIAFNFLAEDARTEPGVALASRTLLRLGVGLLGARITLSQIATLGVGTLALVVISMAATIGAGLLLARLLNRHWSFGLLTGGAVAICGASAALAISAILPQRRDLDDDTLFTVVAVTTLSTLAMILYPLLFPIFGFTPHQAGILFGATIHDVAQVVGAGYAVSQDAGDTATLVKLLRVTLLPVVLLGIMVMAPQGGGQRGSVRLPWFVVLFGLLVLVNSFGLLPADASALLSEVSRWLLIVAIAALGVKTSLGKLVALGPGHLALPVLLSVVIAAVAMIGLTLV